MPVGDAAAVDLAVGLLCVVLIASLACAALAELISSSLNLRARHVALAVQSLLRDEASTERFFEHPRVTALSHPRTGRRPLEHTRGRFAFTALDLFAPPTSGSRPATR